MIPAMTDTMGKYWNQPKRELIEIDATHALMPKWVFEELREYSSTIPTGVYPGKMWRRHDGIFDPRTRQRNDAPGRWLLCWYGDEDHGRCEIHFREILLV